MAFKNGDNFDRVKVKYKKEDKYFVGKQQLLVSRRKSWSDELGNFECKRRGQTEASERQDWQ